MENKKDWRILVVFILERREEDNELLFDNTMAPEEEE